MKILAAVLSEINKPLIIEELLVPDLKAGQALVKIAYSGICHTQLNEMRGLKGEDKFLPHTLGHEGSGIVEAIGADVKKVKIGDRVVLTWIKGSGSDISATSYKRKDGSIVNSGAISTFMTKAVISENRLVKILKEMPLREAALLGCAIPTGAGIVLNIAKVKTQDSIAVFGAGGIGLASVMAASARDVKTIIAIDIFDHKLELAQKIGATYLINSVKENPVIKISDITKGVGVDYAIEAAGTKETMENAFLSVRDRGGVCILSGNLKHEEKINIDPMNLIKGKQIIGAWGGETNPDEDIPKYMEWYMSGKMDLTKLITHEYQLESINEAFDNLEQGKVGRSLIQMR